MRTNLLFVQVTGSSHGAVLVATICVSTKVNAQLHITSQFHVVSVCTSRHGHKGHSQKSGQSSTPPKWGTKEHDHKILK
jgi:hypothetical protein